MFQSLFHPFSKLSPRQFGVIAIICMGAFIAFRLGTELTHETPAEYNSYTIADQANYITGMLQSDNPHIFDADISFGNGVFTDAMQSNSGFYMTLLSRLHQLTDENIGKTIRLYNALGEAIYLPGMFLFLYSVTRKRWVALGLAFVSVHPTTLTITKGVWGWEGNWMVPYVLYTAFVPYLAWLVAEYGFQRELTQPKPESKLPFGKFINWRILGIGILYGAAFNWVHGISGIAFTEITIGVAFFYILRRRLSFTWLVWFGLGFMVVGILRVAGGNVAGIPDSTLTIEGSRLVIEWGRVGLVFPWNDPWQLRDVFGVDFDTAANWMAVIITSHLVLTLAFMGLIWRDKPRIKLWKSAFVLLQVIFTMLLISVGWLPLLLLYYGWQRIWRDEVDEWDRGLAVALTLSLLSGAMQQIIAYYLWQVTDSPALTGIVFELARFTHFAYIPLYGLLGRMVWYISHEFAPTKNHSSESAISPLPIAAGVFLLYIIYTNHSDTFYPLIGDSLSNGSAMVMGALAVLLTRRYWLPAVRPAWIPVVAGALLVTLGALVWMNEREQTDEALGQYVITPSYIEATEWIRTNTPPNSLFHTVYSDPSFRYYARRPIVSTNGDWNIAIYSAHDPLVLNDLRRNLFEYTFDAQTVINILNEYGAEYIFNRNTPDAPQFIGQDDALIYENEDFAVYEIAKLPPIQTPLATYPDLYGAYQNHPAPLAEDAVIFNPAQGFIAQRQAIIEQIATLINNTDLPEDQFSQGLDLLWILQHIRFEAQLNLSDEQRAALDDWRTTKSESSLQAAGIDYLFFDNEWAGFLSEAESTILNEEYETVQRWQFGNMGFTLLK